MLLESFCSKLMHQVKRSEIELGVHQTADGPDVVRGVVCPVEERGPASRAIRCPHGQGGLTRKTNEERGTGG